MATLFEPVQLGSLVLANRVFIAPLTRTRADEDGVPSELAATYYSQRASAGLIVTEATQISPMGKGYSNTPGIHSQAQVRGWERIVESVHKSGGRIFLQLWHVGRISHTSLLPNNAQPVAPSAIRANADTHIATGSAQVSEPVALSASGIKQTLADYRSSASNAKEAGFDGVEIHAANGYLIDQFLRTGANQRTDEYGGAASNRIAVEALLLKLNEEKPQHHLGAVTFGAICDRYIEEELPQRYSTRKSYLSNIKLHIRPRWERYLLHQIRPMVVEGWLKNLDMAPKSKAHIRSVMHLLYECAARWELFNDRRNPIEMVRVKDSTKRRQRPAVLTVSEYEAILGLLKEPYRTMVIVAQCLGLRVSEIAALQWQDFDFERQQLLVQRSIVNGNVDDVKTEYSRDHVPLHESLVEVLLAWSKQALPTEEGWVFASAHTNKPYHPTDIQKRHIRPAGFCLVACPNCGAGVGVWCSQDRPTPNGKRLLIHDERKANAGKYSRIGWHTFRHTYRSWLDETGAPMKVQQELMRHASIQTTMNVYGQAMSSSKREANSKVVEMVLKPIRASA